MYSRMGKELHEKDEEFNTHKAFYEQYPVIADVIFIENVTEYPRSTVESHLGPDFDVQDVQVDPRNVGLGVGRARSFFVAYKKDKIKWNAEYSLTSFLECISSKSVLKAKNYFWQSHPKDQLSDAEDSWFKLISNFVFPNKYDCQNIVAFHLLLHVSNVKGIGYKGPSSLKSLSENGLSPCFQGKKPSCLPHA